MSIRGIKAIIIGLLLVCGLVAVSQAAVIIGLPSSGASTEPMTITLQADDKIILDVNDTIKF